MKSHLVIIRNTILSACLILLGVFSCVCYGAESPNGEARSKNAIDRFGRASVECFEQMFQTEKFDFGYQGKCGCNILHYAALTGNLNRVKLLIERGADVNAEDKNGLTVLHFAAKSGNLKLVKWLVEKGLDVNSKNVHGGTILHDAARSGNMELVRWLVGKGLDVNAKTF